MKDFNQSLDSSQDKLGRCLADLSCEEDDLDDMGEWDQLPNLNNPKKSSSVPPPLTKLAKRVLSTYRDESFRKFTSSSVMQVILAYLQPKPLVKCQQLNRKFYDKFVPFACKQLGDTLHYN